MKYGLVNIATIILVVLVPLLSCAQTMANDRSLAAYKYVKHGQPGFVITKNDETYIKAGAERTVRRFMDLLNFISTARDLDVAEIEKVSRESFLIPGNRIFYDSAALIEDDLRNTDITKRSKEKPVCRYLNDFDLLYRKTKDLTISFSNIRISDVKNAQYLYILVSYDCLFKGRSVISDFPYSMRKRIAELKAEKLNNKWKTWIVNIHYLRPTDTMNAIKDNIAIAENTGHEVNAAADDNQDSAALAPGVKYIVSPQNKTNNIRKDSTLHGTPDELYSYYIREALFAESQRRNEEALKDYNMALVNKPDESAKLNFKIQQLTTRKQCLEQVEAKYTAGQYKAAIEACEKAIKTDPQYAAYYFQNGKCWERLNDFKQAIRNYSKAIEYDASCSDVYKARGALHEIDGEYTKAIADYSIYANMNKGNAFIYHKIAFLDIAMDNLNGAMEALDKATSITDTIASLFYLKGELLYKLKKTATAKSHFTKALSLDSTDMASLFYRALCEIDLEEITKAAADFGRLRKQDTARQYYKRIMQTGMDFYKSSASLSDAGNLDAALKTLDWAIAVDPDNDQFRLKRGDCLFAKNDFSGAIDCYTEAIHLNPANYNARKQRGIARFNTKKYKDAITDFSASLRINPKAAQPYKYSGDTYLLLQDYPNAITNYEAAINAVKTTRSASTDVLLAEINDNLGEAYFHFGNPFKAIEHFNEALKTDNNNARVYFNRGQTFLNFNEFDKAEDDFKKALALDNTNPLWNFRLGELYQKRAKYDQAIIQYEMAISVDDNKSLCCEPRYNRAICLVNSNRYADALSDYQAIKAYNRTNDFKNFNIELGSVYLNIGKPDSALICFNNALIKDSLNTAAVYLKALACIQKNRKDEALYWLEKALALSPGKFKLTAINQDFAALKEESRFKNLLLKYN